MNEPIGIIISSITIAQIEMLEELFSVLTPDGWQSPQWLVNMRERKESC